MEEFIPLARSRFLACSKIEHEKLKPLAKSLEKRGVVEGDYVKYMKNYKTPFLMKIKAIPTDHFNIAYHYDKDLYEYHGCTFDEATEEQKKSLRLQYMFCLKMIKIKPNFSRLYWKTTKEGYFDYTIDNTVYRLWNAGAVAIILPYDDKAEEMVFLIRS